MLNVLLPFWTLLGDSETNTEKQFKKKTELSASTILPLRIVKLIKIKRITTPSASRSQQVLLVTRFLFSPLFCPSLLTVWLS